MLQYASLHVVDVAASHRRAVKYKLSNSAIESVILLLCIHSFVIYNHLHLSPVLLLLDVFLIMFWTDNIYLFIHSLIYFSFQRTHAMYLFSANVSMRLRYLFSFSFVYKLKIHPIQSICTKSSVVGLLRRKRCDPEGV